NPSCRGLLDVRVRRGLLYALGREALANALYEGRDPMVSDTFIPPDDARWDWVKDSIVRYPHDVRRAEELFSEAGLRRGQDGVFVSSAGMRMTLPFWGNAGSEFEQEVAIAADQWKNFGVLTEQFFFTRAQQDDRQFAASFPGLLNARFPFSDVGSLEPRFRSSSCPSEQNG